MPTPKKKAKTLADFAAAHDAKTIIRNKAGAALAAMRKEGRENWEYEGDFVRRAGLAGRNGPAAREMFAAHVVEAPGTHGRDRRVVWFADAAVAAKLRKELADG